MTATTTSAPSFAGALSPQAPLLCDLDEVVDEPDQAQAGHQEQHEDPGPASAAASVIRCASA
jgi:hypothetical protein